MNNSQSSSVHQIEKDPGDLDLKQMYDLSPVRKPPQKPPNKNKNEKENPSKVKVKKKDVKKQQ